MKSSKLTFLSIATLASTSVLSFALVGPEAMRLAGTDVAPSISCAEIYFGLTADPSIGSQATNESYTTNGVVLIDEANTTFSTAFSATGDYALRMSSAKNAGSAVFAFTESYLITKAMVYCLPYINTDGAVDSSPKVSVATDSTSTSTQTPTWTSYSDASDLDGGNHLVFDGLDGGNGSYTKTFTIKGVSGGGNRIYVNKVVLTVGGYSSGGGTASSEDTSSSESSGQSSSSSQSSSPSSSSSSSSSEVTTTGDLDSDYAALDSTAKSYYSSVDLDLTGSSLKSAFATKISSNTKVISYGNLKTNAYPYTDKDSDGNIIDIYHDGVSYVAGSNYSSSNGTRYGGYNREHVIPQSIFNEDSPMVSDIFHVYPTDAYVNLQRSNYPYGNVADAEFTSANGCMLGTSAHSLYSGTVFEVADEYKGDIARAHMFFVTRYESYMGSSSTWKEYALFDYSSWKGLSTYAISLFMEWAAEDPVSERERERNEAIYGLQNNRNPYVDFPSLAEAVFG